MKSTPIMELETITGLQSLDDRRDPKLLSQAATFKRLQDHPMRQRLSQPTKGRLKRESFVHQSRMLERRQEDILDHDPKEIPPCLAVPAWSGRTSPVIRCTIPGVGQKDSQSGPERKSLTQEYLETNYLLMALLRMQFGMEGKDSTSSTQEAKKTKSALLPAYTPQTTKLKQKP